jgi:RNA polymerase primary sigma factor
MELGDWYENSDIEDYSDYDDNIISLREWQRRGKRFFFDNNGCCIYEVTTGSGKTFFTIDIIKELLKKENLRALIVVPKNVILETGWYKELFDAGIPIHKIGVYYGTTKEYAQFTLTNMQNLQKIPLEMFDMIVLDEIHNYATTRLLEILNHPFKYKIGLTATLKRADNKHTELMKMFNYNIFKYGAEEALFDEILNPFIFINIGVKLDSESLIKYDDYTQQLNTVFKTGGSYNFIMKSSSPLKMKMLSLINQRKMLVNNYHEKFIIAVEIIKKHKHNKVIVFNQYNDQTSKLYWHLLDDAIDCRVLHSGITKEKRDQALIDFRNDKFNVLLTSKVLDEGYNLPKLDVAIIMAGDTTDKQTIQRMGRVLRKKDDGYSMLYQIYCKKTIEETSAEDRAIMFKKLSSDYKEIDYMGDKSVI